MTLAELTPWLFARTSGGLRWGLDRTEALLAGVGDPHRAFPSILIGGTNGKGSAAAFCEAALRRGAARKVGLYTSPHLVSFTERIRIDGHPVADEVVVDVATRLRPAIEASGASFFEATTAMAFLVFAEAGVDIAVVEVGLGGRLDSTNVLDPLVTAVTNVSLDHAEYLGEDLEKIAEEKAGIFKRGVPALSASPEPNLERVLRESAMRAGAPFYPLDELAALEDVRTSTDGTTFTLVSRRWGRQALRSRLPGVHQARNAALAVELLGFLPDRLRPGWGGIAEGVAAARWPGRLQIERRGETTWVLDVAHNPDGARSLASALEALTLPKPRVLVAGILTDKDWRTMLRVLAPSAEQVVLTTPPSAPTSRRWDPAVAAAWLQSELGRDASVVPDLGQALGLAERTATQGTVIVTGSLHTVGDALHHLGFPTF